MPHQKTMCGIRLFLALVAIQGTLFGLELSENNGDLLSKEESMKSHDTVAIKTNIGVSHENCVKVGAMLNQLLSDEAVLYIKILNFHWNVRDPYFDTVHAFFKKLYEAQLDIVDDVAERARTIGILAYGSMQEFLKNTKLKEQIGYVPTKEMLKQLLDDHEIIIRSMHQMIALSAEYGDIGTNNFLQDILNRHEKTAWMLRANFE